MDFESRIVSIDDENFLITDGVDKKAISDPLTLSREIGIQKIWARAKQGVGGLTFLGMSILEITAVLVLATNNANSEVAIGRAVGLISVAAIMGTGGWYICKDGSREIAILDSQDKALQESLRIISSVVDTN